MNCCFSLLLFFSPPPLVVQFFIYVGLKYLTIIKRKYGDNFIKTSHVFICNNNFVFVDFFFLSLAEYK